MKYKLIAISAVLVMLAVGFGMSLSDYTIERRYHQHMEVKTDTLIPCEHKSSELCTHLPIVSIKTTSPAGISLVNTTTQSATQATTSPSAIGFNTPTKKDSVTKINPAPFECEVRIYDKSGEFNHLEDTPSAQSIGTYGKRGNSSFRFDKSSYKLELLNEDGTENHDVEFLGMPKHNEWILNGPILDKTLMRNYMSFNIAGEIMQYTPKVRYLELVIDGQYRGLYLATEGINRGDDRIPLTKYSEGDPFTSYIIRSDRAQNPINQLNNFTRYAHRRNENSVFEVIYPPIAKLTPELVKYIEDDLSHIEKAIYSFDYTNDEYGYSSTLNTDAFVDYFIINEFSKNADAGIYSTYYYKDIRGKLNIGPVWDFNNAYDNYMDVVHNDSGFVLLHAPIYTMLFKDPDFTEAVIARYNQLRQDVLSEEYLVAYIDDTASWLGESVDRNNEVWGYAFDATKLNNDNKLHPEERNPKDYQEAITKLKEFIIKRGNWLDNNIDNLRQYSHPSKTKKYNH